MIFFGHTSTLNFYWLFPFSLLAGVVNNSFVITHFVNMTGILVIQKPLLYFQLTLQYHLL